MQQQPIVMDPKVAEYIFESQAKDLYAVARDFIRQGHKAGFAAVAVDEDDLKVAYLFRPAAEVLDMPGLPEVFREKVARFNILGFIREGESGTTATVDLMAGLSKPFPALRTYKDIRKGMHAGSVLSFANRLLRLRGMSRDLPEYGYDEFLEELRERGQFMQNLRNSMA